MERRRHQIGRKISRQSGTHRFEDTRHESGQRSPYGADEKELAYAKNYAIKQITKDMENFSFNTAVARLMELVNALFKYDNNQVKNVPLLKETSKDLLLLLAPFAPHFAEELWEQCGFRYSVFDQAFPVCDESALVRDETEYAIQINSKMKTKMMLSKDMSKEDIQHAVMQSDAIRPFRRQSRQKSDYRARQAGQPDRMTKKRTGLAKSPVLFIYVTQSTSYQEKYLRSLR